MDPRTKKQSRGQGKLEAATMFVDSSFLFFFDDRPFLPLPLLSQASSSAAKSVLG